jgi:hypothetical protein
MFIIIFLKIFIILILYNLFRLNLRVTGLVIEVVTLIIFYLLSNLLDLYQNLKISLDQIITSVTIMTFLIIIYI